ncbi:hypothetical protein SMAC4_13270 [Sordaria macrospora]|uniref:uncharacterized protein n=1 Tax=Sordaria macrospora TaxID=5147 RepID=UPI002B28868D|nr:hypothetical protein SMAC4_13270 [Sordaria macrospora]
METQTAAPVFTTEYCVTLPPRPRPLPRHLHHHRGVHGRPGLMGPAHGRRPSRLCRHDRHELQCLPGRSYTDFHGAG